MQLIIVNDLQKLKLTPGAMPFRVVDSCEALDSIEGVDTFFVEKTQVAIGDVKKADRVIIRSVEAEKFLAAKEIYVYFDLAAYPFFQKLQQIVEADVKKKGVLRLHRAMKESEIFSISKEDILVCTYLFGEVSDLYVKQSKRFNDVDVYHVMIMVQFTTGTIAHFEYTTDNHDKITFDWSGDKTIAEFDSREMAPIQTMFLNSPQSIYHTPDAILTSCKPLNKHLQSKLNNLENQFKKAGWNL